MDCGSRVEACDRLADAVSYPQTGYGAAMTACREWLARCAPPAAQEVGSFEQAVAGMSIEALQELYTSTFDLDPHCALDVGWHVFGESCERGGFLAMLRAELRAAGVTETSELPDHLSHLLQLFGRATGVRARELGGAMTVAVDRVAPLLERRGNPYAFLLRAVRLAIAASTAVDEGV